MELGFQSETQLRVKIINMEVEAYPHWNFEHPVMPSRSHLISIPPINIGTSDVESLTSYISRVAFEYQVTPTILLKYGLIDCTKLPKNLINSDSITFPKTINGMGKTTENIVNALQQSTMRDDIYFTTLLGWKGKLSQNNLFKQNRAWCSLCFSEQIREIGFNYEKLLWSLEPVDKCRQHQTSLENKCPHCNRSLWIFSGNSRPGYCAGCFMWLGDKEYLHQEKKTFYTNSEDSTESQCEEIFTKSILEKASSERNRFIHNLADLISQLSFGNINEFSHQVNIWHNNIRILLKGNILPTWDILSKLSSLTGISIYDILTSKKLRISKNAEYEKYQSYKKDNAKQLSVFYDGGDEKVKRIIEVCISEYPPLSASEVARRVGYSSSDRIKLKYPDLYKKIVDNYLSYVESLKIKLPDRDIEQLLVKAIEEEPPPSLQSVFRRMGCRNTGSRYYNKFPHLCSVIAQRYKWSISQLLDNKKVENMLIEALTELPPPSLSNLAKRLKCKRESLKKLYPELVTEIMTKRKGFLLSEKEKYRSS